MYNGILSKIENFMVPAKECISANQLQMKIRRLVLKRQKIFFLILPHYVVHQIVSFDAFENKFNLDIYVILQYNFKIIKNQMEFKHCYQ